MSIPPTRRDVVALIVGAVAVPVKVGLARGAVRLAMRFSAVWVAVEMGLLASEVLFTLPNPTIAAVMPLTVPVNVGLFSGAYVDAALDDVRYGANAEEMVVDKSVILELAIVELVVK